MCIDNIFVCLRLRWRRAKTYIFLYAIQEALVQKLAPAYFSGLLLLHSDIEKNAFIWHLKWLFDMHTTFDWYHIELKSRKKDANPTIFLSSLCLIKRCCQTICDDFLLKLFTIIYVLWFFYSSSNTG